VFGAGVIVAVIGIAMFGVSGLFGSEWEGRQVAKFLERQARQTTAATPEPGRPIDTTA
jgi:hypothetical protein